MLSHAQQLNHALAVDINEQSVCCLLCDASFSLERVSELEAADRSGPMASLRRLLTEVADELQSPPQLDGGVPEAAVVQERPGRRQRRHSSIFGRSAAEFERRDMLVTMLRRWKLLPLAKAFTAFVFRWRVMVSLT